METQSFTSSMIFALSSDRKGLSHAIEMYEITSLPRLQTPRAMIGYCDDKMICICKSMEEEEGS